MVIRIGNSTNLGKPVLIVALAFVVVVIVSLVAYFAGGSGEAPEPAQPPQTGGSITETNPSPSSPASVNQTHSLRVVAVGPIDRLIIIDEGGGSRNYEYKDLAEGWEQELQFKVSSRLWCSSIENLKFSVDGGADKKIEGSGPKSFALRPTR